MNTYFMQALEDRRREKNLSRREFARMELDMSKAKYIGWLNGRNMDEDDKVTILEYLEG